MTNGAQTHRTAGRSSRNGQLHHVTVGEPIDTSSRNKILSTLRAGQDLEQNGHRRVAEANIVHKKPGGILLCGGQPSFIIESRSTHKGDVQIDVLICGPRGGGSRLRKNRF